MAEVSETQYARSADDTRLAYQVAGDGPLDVLVVPGLEFPVDLASDEPGLVRFRRRMSTFSRNAWFEPRGIGASEGEYPPDPNAGVTDADLTAVFDAVGCERVALLGSSNAGPSVIHYAATHPERVSALMLIDTFAYYVREDDYPWGLPPGALERWVTLLRERWATAAALEIVAPSRVTDERFRQWYTRSARLGAGPRQIAERTATIWSWDVRGLLPTLRVPTLVLHREGDRVIRVGAGRYLAEHIPGATYVELPGEDHLFFVGDVDGLLDEVEEFLTGRHQGAEGDAVLATVLFTDIVDSTRQAARLGNRAWTSVTDQHDALVRAALQRYRGREIRTTGDGFLATFDGAARAIRCALDVVAEAKRLPLEVRAGVHTGEVEVRGDDVAGLAVNIGRRVCDLAGPSQVVLSDGVKGSIVGSGIALTDFGTHVLKGVPDEWRLYTVESSFPGDDPEAALRASVDVNPEDESELSDEDLQKVEHDALSEVEWDEP